MLAAALLAIDPVGLGGALLRGRSGPAQDAWLAALRDCLPANTPFRRIPSHAGPDRLIGGLDLSATLSAGRPMLERGILAEADNGILVLPSSERFAAEKAALIADAMDRGEVAIARDGFDRALPARFTLVAFDESANDDERTPAVLAERLAFHLGIDEAEPPSQELPSKVMAAKRILDEVTTSDKIIAALCETVMALGIASPRAALFTVKAARAHAALNNRRVVSDEDAAMAARLVLAPRAVVFPQAPEEPEPENQPESEAEQSNEEQQASAKQLSDVMLEAVKAALPPGLLAGLVAASAMKAAGRSGPGASAKRQKGLRGRPAGTRAGDPRNGSRLNLIATLRAAAPWQRLRAGGGALVKVRREDFRVTRYRRRSETTAIFAVDASGSAALHRLAEAKGAVELILADCYIRRDKVALVAFRGKGADVLLPPTRSLERARRSLAALPGGGGTPLGAGIDASAAIADGVRRGGGTPLLVFLTDGRANVARDGTGNRATAADEALASARRIRMAKHRSLVIDVSPEPHEAARRLAEEMAATYLPLPHADAAQISRSVSKAMPQ